MKDILSEIVEHKRRELAQLKRDVPLEALREQAATAMSQRAARRSMRRALAESPAGIIAEFKRRSPSKGWIHAEADPTQVCPAYAAAGAAALSILTDEVYFGGSLDDIVAARPMVDVPILRKDFVVDEYQLLQACVAGADAVLLIAACLTLDACTSLASQAHALGLEVLLEVHSADELPYVAAAPDMLGVNNRHLGSFVTDVRHSFALAEQLRRQTSGTDAPLLVSESGIADAETIGRLRAEGFRGFLVGERFMRCAEPAQALATFVAQLTTSAQ